MVAGVLGLLLPIVLPIEQRFQNLMHGFCAAGIIAGLIYGPEFPIYRALDWRVSRFYGRISYRFCLYHMVVAFGLARLAFVVCPVSWFAHHALLFQTLLFLLVIVIAGFVSWASQVWVEWSGVNFSKQLCEMLRNFVYGAQSQHSYNGPGSSPNAANPGTVSCPRASGPEA